MNDKQIYIPQFDFMKLKHILEDGAGNYGADRVAELAAELDRAIVVINGKIPQGIVAMNSIVCIKDMDTGIEHTYQLVYPDDADLDHDKISVLAPIGTAILGYEEGDIIEWKVPAGIRKLKIKKVIYQSSEGGTHGSKRVCVF